MCHRLDLLQAHPGVLSLGRTTYKSYCKFIPTGTFQLHGSFHTLFQSTERNTMVGLSFHSDHRSFAINIPNHHVSRTHSEHISYLKRPSMCGIPSPLNSVVVGRVGPSSCSYLVSSPFLFSLVKLTSYLLRLLSCPSLIFINQFARCRSKYMNQSVYHVSWSVKGSSGDFYNHLLDPNSILPCRAFVWIRDFCTSYRSFTSDRRSTCNCSAGMNYTKFNVVLDMFFLFFNDPSSIYNFVLVWSHSGGIGCLI